MDKIPRYISTGFYHSKLCLVQSLFPEGQYAQQTKNATITHK